MCTNVGVNSEIVTPTPLATQNIDITGTQNIDQTNICDDDDGSECLNEAGTFGLGNRFFLEHDQGTGLSVLVESFEQDINQANTCLLFNQCDNFGQNFFGIFPELPEGEGSIATAPTDVDIGSSIQEVHQLNDCDAVTPPNQFCNNGAGTFLVMQGSNNGEISLDDSSQSAQQENNCDDGNVICINFGLTDMVLAAFEGADVAVRDSSQSSQQENYCNDGNIFCNNLGVNSLQIQASGLGAQVNVNTNGAASRPRK